MSDRTHVRFPTSVAEQLAALVEKAGVTRAEFLGRLVELYGEALVARLTVPEPVVPTVESGGDGP